MPPVSVESSHHVFVEAEVGMAGDRRRLARHTFHQVAVAADAEDAMVEQARLVAIEMRLEMLCRDRHADHVADALAERPGGGLDARNAPMLGMPRGSAAELPKLLEVVERNLVAGEVEDAVQQHRTVPGREHESIAP